MKVDFKRKMLEWAHSGKCLLGKHGIGVRTVSTQANARWGGESPKLPSTQKAGVEAEAGDPPWRPIDQQLDQM